MLNTFNIVIPFYNYCIGTIVTFLLEPNLAEFIDVKSQQILILIGTYQINDFSDK